MLFIFAALLSVAKSIELTFGKRADIQFRFLVHFQFFVSRIAGQREPMLLRRNRQRYRIDHRISSGHRRAVRCGHATRIAVWSNPL